MSVIFESGKLPVNFIWSVIVGRDVLWVFKYTEKRFIQMSYK